MNYIKELQKMGLTQNESALYIAAVKLHTFSLAEIAKASGVKRTSCYSVVDSLLQKNLIATIPRSTTKRYIVVDPSAVLEREREKMADVETAMKTIVNLRNSLKKEDTPHIELFSGIQNAKQIFHIILQDSPDSLYGIVNPDYVKKCLGPEFTERWITERIKKNIKRFDLQQNKYISDAFTKKNHDMKRVTKILPDDFDHESTIQIWNNKVGFISDKKEGISFIVTSNEYSKIMKGIFTSLWNVSREIDDFEK